ncbi:amidohydrolase family protein [Caulobacter sp. LARHSG274]
MGAAIPALLAALALLGRGDRASIPYVDAHSHLLTIMAPDEEIALFRAAGLAGVVIMHPDPEALERVAKRHPGYVTPSISLARTAGMTGLRPGPEAVSAFARLQAKGSVCGFGELPTRYDPALYPSDAASFGSPFRQRIYALAQGRKTPVSAHVSLESPETIAAVEAVAADHPDMPLILAHAGWSAEADLIGRLMAGHPNLYADLSIRLDPARADNPNLRLSILTADGVLKPEWRAVIERFPGRFLFAMDVTEANRHGRIPELLATARRAFAPLPREVEDAVAHGNIQRLMRGCRPPGR